MKKRTIWIVLIVVLLAAAGGGYVVYANSRALAVEAAGEPQVQTATASRGDLIITADGTGTLVPAEEVEVGFLTGGVLTEVLVKVGDRVEAGDVLARLDDSSAQEQVTQAVINLRLAELGLTELAGEADPANLASAQAQVTQAEINLRLAELGLAELTQQADPADLASAQAKVTQAEIDLEDAKEDLNSVKAGPTEAQQVAAEAALRTAEENYEELLARPDPEAVEQAGLELAKARNSLWNVQLERDALNGREGTPNYQKEMMQASVANAEIAVRLAEINYQEAQTPATAAEIESAAAEVQQAKEDLEELRNSPTSFDLTQAHNRVNQAEYNLTQAQAQLDTLLVGASPEDLEAAQLSVELARNNLASAQVQLDDLLAGASPEDLEAAQLSVEQARNNLISAQDAVEDTVLRAPFAGTVMAVEAQVGESVGTTPIITLTDMEEPLVLFWVEEIDLMSVAPGNAVNVVFEALPDYTFPGEVVSVDPALVTVDGTPAVQVWASVDLTSHPVDLLSGMNAEVEIVAGEALDAVLVPIQALRELGPGQYAVFVVQPNGELELRPVKVGLEDYVNAEILSGLEVGEVVSTGTVESSEAAGGTSTGDEETMPGIMRFLGGG
jgi:HlyD family secretion protein